MDYIELHLSKHNFERIIFISIIVILAIIAVAAVKRSPGACPKSSCNETAEAVPAAQEVKPAEEAQKEEPEEKETQKDILIYNVDIENMRFAPREMVIENNSMIVFRNKEVHTAHKIYEVKGLFYGPRMEPGDRFNYTFTEVGNFTVFSMMGKEVGTEMSIEVINS